LYIGLGIIIAGPHTYFHISSYDILNYEKKDGNYRFVAQMKIGVGAGDPATKALAGKKVAQS
jgi:hypothetical protein